jgi:hypothetical protein
MLIYKPMSAIAFCPKNGLASLKGCCQAQFFVISKMVWILQKMLSLCCRDRIFTFSPVLEQARLMKARPFLLSAPVSIIPDF